MAISIEIRRSIFKLGSGLHFMKSVTIKDSTGKFDVRDANPVIVIDDGSPNRIYSIIVIISQNQKEMKGYFATDAFNGISAPVTIIYGYAGDKTATVISNVDIPALTLADGPGLSGITLPDADKAFFGL